MKHWWEEKQGGIGKALLDTVESLQDQHDARVLKYKRLTGLYKDTRFNGFYPGEWRDNELERKESYNVLKSSIDTITAKITQQDVNPSASTFGAAEDLQSKAKAMEKLVLGVMQKEQAHTTSSLCFRESGITDVSVAKVFEQNGDICIRKIHPSRIMIDEDASLDGRPPSIFQYEWYTKSQLRYMFPKAKSIINSASADMIDYGGKLISERVKVYEAWQRPLGPKFPGKRVVIVDGGGLLGMDDWTDKEFPFVIGRWEHDLQGWHGVSLAEQLEGVQNQINEILENISINLEETRPFWLVPTGSQINWDGELGRNDFNRMVEYTGPTPPTRATPPAVGEQEIRLLQHLIEWGYEIAGVSQLSATSKQPANFESGRAIQMYLDVETIRHSMSAKMYQQWHVDMFNQIVCCARRIARRNPNWAVSYMGKDKDLQQIKWSDANLEDDKFQLHVHPISALPQHPAARLERVMELARDQLIDRETFSSLASMPDLEKHNQLTNAPYEYLERTFEHMLSPDGKYIAPLRYQPNLETGIKMATNYYLRHKVLDTPDEQCNRVARWIEEASGELDRQAQAAMQAEMAAQQPGPSQATTGGQPLQEAVSPEAFEEQLG